MEKYLFFDGTSEDPRWYNASDFAMYWGEVITDGIIRKKNDALSLKPTSPSYLQVNVSKGHAIIDGHMYVNTDDLIMPVPNVSNNNMIRYDALMLRLNRELRTIRMFVVSGVESTVDGTALADLPQPTRNSQIYEMMIATIKVQTSGIIVTDKRGDKELCPWVGSDILPNFDDSSLAELVQSVNEHENSPTIHVPFAQATLSGTTYNVTLPRVTKLTEGMGIAIKPNANSPSSAWLSVNGLAVGRMVKGNAVFVTTDDLISGYVYTFRYNGGLWVLQGTSVKLNDTVFSTSTTEAATANAVRQVNDRFTLPARINAVLATGWYSKPNMPGSGLTYYKDAFNIVHINGRVSRTDGNTSRRIATLPVGYRPSKYVEFQAGAWISSSGYIQIDTDGNIDVWLDSNTTSNTNVLINGSFPTTI